MFKLILSVANAGAQAMENADTVDLPSLRAYRLSRVQEQMRRQDVAAAVLFDPINIRYATGSRCMAVWTLHNHVRAAFVPAEGLTTVFEFGAERWPTETETLESVGEVRPAVLRTHLYAGSRKAEMTSRFAGELADLVNRHCGGERRIAFDHIDPGLAAAVAERQYVVVDGEALMERARLIKSAEEIKAMKYALGVAKLGIARMREALRPGMTENQLWAMLHATNIEHGGEWIETRLLSSGPKTNPWMQECGDRVIEAGDLVAFDTDMIGPFGYCADVSRTLLCGDETPSAEQRRLYRLAAEQISHNASILQAGRTLAEVVEDEWEIPPEFTPFRYGFGHGVGLKDEYPFLPNRRDIDLLSDPEQVLRPGMVICVESYIGAVGGSQGVKLEDQVLVTESGPEVLSDTPLEDRLKA